MSSYAIVQVGNRQYRVEDNTVFDVERFERPEGDEVKLEQVLLVAKDSKAQVGQPYVSNANVVCAVEEELRLPKVISFKFKRRKGYRRKKGHRQSVVRLRVKSINTDNTE
jgi:large subunit ribosomal protein L21